MKKQFFLVLLLINTLGFSQENIQKNNSICFSYGSIVSKIDKYSPVLELAYFRTIWNELKVGVVFQTYQYHHITHYEDPSNKTDNWYIPDIVSNCIFFELGYDKRLLRSYSIYPYLCLGGNNCKVKYFFKNDTTKYINQKGMIPTFVGGVSAIYRLQRLSFLGSYDYSMNIQTNKQIFEGPFGDCEARPNRFFDFKHSTIKIGIKYNF